MPKELEEVQVATNGIGAGSYGQCILKRFLRLGIQVVEKLLHDSNLAHIYQEAYYMQLFSHRCASFAGSPGQNQVIFYCNGVSGIWDLIPDHT